jgi:hypothetical protein
LHDDVNAAAERRGRVSYRAAALLALSVLPFVIGLNTEFAGDDPFLIVTRLDPARVSSPAAFFTEDYWGSLASGLYRPLGLSVLFGERLLFGTSPWPYRLVSLALHTAVAFTLWALFTRIASRDIGWLGAAVFACHPIHAEAILFAYGQLDLLAALFLLASLWFFLQERPVLGTLCAITAMLCKESALIAPVLTWWMFRARRTPAWTHPAALSLLAALSYAFVKLLAIGTLVVPATGTVTGGAIANEIWAKSIVVSAAHAVRLSVIPAGQTIYYGHLRDSLIGQPWQELLWLSAAIVAAALWLRHASRPRLLLTAFGFFVACWIPVSNIVPTGVLVAERALYLPSAGLALAAGLALRRVRWTVVLALLLVASCAATRTAWNWRTEESLWASTVHHHPRSPRGHASLGLAYLKRFERERTAGLLTRAENSFDTALSLNRRATEALYGKGLLLLHRNRDEEACAFFRAALEQRPGDHAIASALSECERRLRSAR